MLFIPINVHERWNDYFTPVLPLVNYVVMTFMVQNGTDNIPHLWDINVYIFIKT